ncbi:hypothetical protein [Acidovorax sp. JHL-9]|uniref:hypothetical protein n=1 Tax=Acidovorax sp. JHL-9 TaxID=1276756 RepID=UPI000415297F|nr:hypothetical protein [Acidovorax sp. JHL-9]
MTNFEHITQVLEQTIDGEPIPTFRSPAFAALIAAASAISASPQDCEKLGRSCCLMLLDRLSASMHGEREIQLLKDSSRPLC